jgi:hypothetical protein
MSSEPSPQSPRVATRGANRQKLPEPLLADKKRRLRAIETADFTFAHYERGVRSLPAGKFAQAQSGAARPAHQAEFGERYVGTDALSVSGRFDDRDHGGSR